jgi:hypothetical protein
LAQNSRVTSGAHKAISVVPPADSVPVGVVAGDIDNDGIPDLFILRDGTSSLYKNDGKGHFTEITASSGLRPLPFLPGAAALVGLVAAAAMGKKTGHRGARGARGPSRHKATKHKTKRKSSKRKKR